MIQFAALVAVATLGVGLLAAVIVRKAPTLRLQLIGLALVAVLLPLASVLLSGVAMFQSGHDLTILAVAAASSTAALAAAVLLARGFVRPIEELHRTSAALAGGDLTARAEPGGALELRELARSLNETAANLEQLFGPAASSSPGQPRPPHAAGVASGNARGSRRRARLG
jgi:methyl-accepting chemotaxis protein